MYLKFNASLCKKAIKGLLLALAILSIHTTVNAQHHSNGGLTYGGGSNGYGGDSEWGISLMAGYDVPTADLATTYKAAPTFGISLIRNLGNFTFNATIGYVSYQPKLDTFYVDASDHSQGYIHYGNYSSIEFYAGAAYNIQVADGAKLYFGLNIGTYYTHLAYDSNDGSGDENDADGYNEASYVAPKIGVNFMISDNMSLGVEGKYNFQLSSSSGTGDAYDSGYSTTVEKSFSGNVVLTYNF